MTRNDDPPYYEEPERCPMCGADNADDNGEGFTDCDDQDCAADPSCQ